MKQYAGEGAWKEASSDTTFPFPLAVIIFEACSFSQISTNDLIPSVD